jgi:hypothetical protein
MSLLPIEESVNPNTDAVGEVREALDETTRIAERCAGTFTSPAAPGKWSPAQVVEHIALSLEAAAVDLSGKPSGLPSLPAPLRFLARKLLFERVLRNGSFPKARTNKAMNLASGPETASLAAARLDTAWRTFATACDAHGGAPATSRVFGTIPLSDYARFQALHTAHHAKQLIRS